MHIGDVQLVKAIMAERMEEADHYRRHAGTRRPRPSRPRVRRFAQLRHSIHLPHVVRHRPV